MSGIRRSVDLTSIIPLDEKNLLIQPTKDENDKMELKASAVATFLATIITADDILAVAKGGKHLTSAEL